MNSDLINSLKKRYAVKKFDPNKKLSEDQVNELLEVARLTATSYGLQLMKLVVVEDPVKREELVDCSFGQKQVVDASHLLVLCREKEIDLDHIEGYVENISEIRGVNKDSLDGFKNAMSKSILTKRKDDQIIWMDKQVYIMLGNLMTACAMMGIGSCPMEGFIPEEYDEVLGLDNLGLASVLVLPVGFGATDDPNAKRKKVRRSEQQFVVRLHQ